MTPAAAPRLPRVRASELVGRGWLNTGGRTITLQDLRGRVVLLDFWTFCCINCLHVLDELRDLEQRFGDVLTIVGVHSPKFEHEADPEALAAAVERYEVHHPVLDDPELVTWQAYTARAWPTLVVVDPEGYVVAQLAGEGHAASVEALVAELVAEHRAKGTLREGDGPYVPPTPTAGTLRFPAKVVGLPGGNLLVADAGHHALAEVAPDGETLVRRIGSGERGLVDGGPGDARFAEPNGLCHVPDALRADLGYDVLVADTANHVLRGVRLDDGSVVTVAGTGEQFMVGAPDNVRVGVGVGVDVGVRAGGGVEGVGARPTIRPLVPRDLPPDPPRSRTDALDPAPSTRGHLSAAGDSASSARRHHAATGDSVAGVFEPGGTYDARAVKLSSPWDVVWSADLGVFLVAMAGNHTLWAFDPVAGTIAHLAGTMNEGLEDGPVLGAWFAQPSGLAVGVDEDGKPGRVWVADAETSAVRWIGPRVTAADDLVVHTAAGQGLFDFGHRDGAADQALLQHPLGVAALPDGSVLVADTYNGAVRRVVPGRDGEPGEVTTLATGLAEPSGLVVLVDGAAWSVGAAAAAPTARLDVLVVESAAHRLTRVAVPADLAGDVLDGGARRTQRPVTDVAPGALRLEVPFRPAPGQKLDTRFGPSTRLRVSSTPPELLVTGAGDGTDLDRHLVIDPEVPGGVLHVTAQAASCDDDPAVEFPACHLAQQDWGVPVRVVPAGEADPSQRTLTLPLLG